MLRSVRQLSFFVTTAESETVSRHQKSVYVSVLSLGSSVSSRRNYYSTTAYKVTFIAQHCSAGNDFAILGREQRKKTKREKINFSFPGASEQGGQGGGCPPVFQEFYLFSPKFHPKNLKSLVILNLLPPPVFASPPHF